MLFGFLLYLKNKQNSSIAEEKIKCSCKDVCRSVYPCLLVEVTYRVQHSNTTATSTLYHTGVILNHQVHTSCIYSHSQGKDLSSFIAKVLRNWNLLVSTYEEFLFFSQRVIFHQPRDIHWNKKITELKNSRNTEDFISVFFLHDTILR